MFSESTDHVRESALGIQIFSESDDHITETALGDNIREKTFGIPT